MAYKRKIQVRRGAASARPTLSSGEFGLDTDTGSEALWIGTPAGNKQLARTAPTYVDIPVVFNLDSSFGSQATNYSGIGGALSANESAVAYSPCGITGTIVGMYVQMKANTHNANFTLTLQSGAADAASLAASDFVITVTPSTTNGSKTDATLSVTPTMILGLKFVSASGAGSSTLHGITLIVRCTLS